MTTDVLPFDHGCELLRGSDQLLAMRQRRAARAVRLDLQRASLVVKREREGRLKPWMEGPPLRPWPAGAPLQPGPAAA